MKVAGTDAGIGATMDASGLDAAGGAELVARRVALDAHAGQVDRLGRPMFDHVSGVAERAGRRLSEVGVVVGLLHDTIERAHLTRPELEAYGFSAEMLDLVEVLTQQPGERSQTYLRRCADDPIAAIIKEADLSEKIDAARAIGDDEARRQQARWNDRLRSLRQEVERRRSDETRGAGTAPR